MSGVLREAEVERAGKGEILVLSRRLHFGRQWFKDDAEIPPYPLVGLIMTKCDSLLASQLYQSDTTISWGTFAQ